ncbi:hypothetical protein EJP617_10190 [Erwinia sp. Ejp617]|nr:hypothetical protein [Erwinia sp. Ejp617]ADP10700.1 hypothetical protein EJP617_10190 [Erwinia sp. Ejp617]
MRQEYHLCSGGQINYATTMGALGFDTGQKIEVITEPGQLIIRLAVKG